MTRILLVLTFLLPASTSFAQRLETLPAPALTSGAVRDLTVQQICRTKWGSDARAVTAQMKQKVRNAYGFDAKSCPITVMRKKRGHYAEIDHLIPRSLGGADDIRNLWPQCYEPVYQDKSQQADGAHKKDQLETYLHKSLCQTPSEELLRQYQNDIRYNWIALYHRIYRD